MADRFDKFTERARKVLQLAQEEAQRFNHNYIGTEHLLLGLVREGEGIAAGVLESLGVSLDKVRSQVIYVLNQGPAYERTNAQPGTFTSPGSLVDGAREVVGRARVEAFHRGDAY